MALADLQQEMPRLLKDHLQKIPLVMLAAMGQGVDNQGPPEPEFSSSPRLGHQSNRLALGFVPGQPENITTITVTGARASLVYGSRVPYLVVHENGTFIRGTPKMIAFFWAKWRQTRFEKYRIIALAVRKNGGVTIPPRKTFAPGVERFRTKLYPPLLEELAGHIIRVFNG